MKSVKDIEESVAKNNAEVRAEANPEMLKVMDEVQKCFDEESKNLDDRFEADNRLRKWARDLCGLDLDISEVEELNKAIQDCAPNSSFFFHPKRSNRPITFFRNAFNLVERLDKYIYRLESIVADTIIRNTDLEREIEDIKNNSQFTKLSFLGLIKLAFKRLLKRRS